MELQYSEIADKDMSLRELILSIKAWFAFLGRKWYILLAALLIGGLLGYFYFKYTPPAYLASSTFVIEESESGGGDKGLASMFGQPTSAGLFQGDNLQWLYTTKLMIQKTLLSPTVVGQRELIIDRFLAHEKDAIKMRQNPTLAKVKFEAMQTTFSREQTIVLDACVGLIKAKYLKVNSIDKTQGVIKVDMTSPDELLSKSFVENLVSTVNDYYIYTKTSSKANQITQLQKKVDQYNSTLNQTIVQSAEETDNVPYPNPDLTVAQVKPQRTNVDIGLTTNMYGQTMSALESAKIELAKATPLITVIDSPLLPLPVVKTSMSNCLAVGMGLLLFLTLIVLILGRAYKMIMAGKDLPYNATVATA